MAMSGTVILLITRWSRLGQGAYSKQGPTVLDSPQSELVCVGQARGADRGCRRRNGLLHDQGNSIWGPRKRPLALRAQADIGTTDSPANFAEVRY